MDDQIDIRGIPREEILKALYDNSRPLGMGHLHFTPEPMHINHAKGLVNRDEDFDYVQGRVIKVRLKKGQDYLSPWLYDRDNGEGAAARIIAELRERFPVKRHKPKSLAKAGEALTSF